jgi:hypothetical protein
MIAAHPHGIGKDHVLFDEDRESRRAAAHVDTGRPQLLLILHKAGNARDIGGRGDARQFKITALDAIKRGSGSTAVSTDSRCRSQASRMPICPRGSPRPVRWSSAKFTGCACSTSRPSPIIGHVAGRQHARHVLFGHDRMACKIPFAPAKPVAARLRPRETGDGMIDPHIRHFLRGLHGGADRALGFVHRARSRRTAPRATEWSPHQSPGTRIARPWGPHPFQLAQPIRPIKAQHQAGDL